MPIKNLTQKILISLLLAVAVFAAFTFYTDLQSLQAVLSRFEWWVLLPVLGLTAINLGARFVKWAYYLRLLEIHDVAFDNSVAIFLSNYVLILTPGKVGGLLKSYFLKQTNDVPMARTMPIMIAERLTDGLGLVMMTVVALIAYPDAWPAVALVLLGMVGIIVVAQVRPLALRLLAIGERLPVIKRFAHTLHLFYESSYELFQLKPLLWTTFLGTIARATEGIALYFVLLGLDVLPSYDLLQQAISISALANIIGVVVMLPGGLGGTEASMAGLLDYFVKLTPATATAATIITRLGTFWLSALLGMIALLVKRHVFFAPAPLPLEKRASGKGASARLAPTNEHIPPTH